MLATNWLATQSTVQSDPGGCTSHHGSDLADWHLMSMWVRDSLSLQQEGKTVYPLQVHILKSIPEHNFTNHKASQISGFVTTNRGKQACSDASYITQGKSQTGDQKIGKCMSIASPSQLGPPPSQRPPLYAHKLAVITQFVVPSWVLRLAASAGLLSTCCSGLLLLLALGFHQEQWT